MPSSSQPSAVGQAPPVTEQQLNADEHQAETEPTVPAETPGVDDAPRSKVATNVSKGKKILRQTKLWNDEASVVVKRRITRKSAMKTPSTSQESELQRAEWLMEGIELVEPTGKKLRSAVVDGTAPPSTQSQGKKMPKTKTEAKYGGERKECQVTTASTDTVPTSQASGSQGTKRRRQTQPHSDDADDTEKKQTPPKKVRKTKATQAYVSLATDPSTWPPSQRLDTTTISKQLTLDCYKVVLPPFMMSSSPHVQLTFLKLKKEELAVLEPVKATRKKNGEEWPMHLYKAVDVELIAWKKHGGPDAFEAMLDAMEEKHEKRKGSRRPFRRPRWKVETAQTMEGPISKERLCLSLKYVSSFSNL
ncbi:hypothetical protein EWM64_g1537 [Hericium alpestre]|uniref:Uncharacterized protein n=1 Tax=Hericium alpestre TaxID=135208 RepID=A0A4Z0A6W6_9AGAM|nr:hypothetical protein EWM64_g1537 [Hericium alpestre]